MAVAGGRFRAVAAAASLPPLPVKSIWISSFPLAALAHGEAAVSLPAAARSNPHANPRSCGCGDGPDENGSLFGSS